MCKDKSLPRLFAHVLMTVVSYTKKLSFYSMLKMIVTTCNVLHSMQAFVGIREKTNKKGLVYICWI